MSFMKLFLVIPPFSALIVLNVRRVVYLILKEKKDSLSVTVFPDRKQVLQTRTHYFRLLLFPDLQLSTPLPRPPSRQNTCLNRLEKVTP